MEKITLIHEVHDMWPSTLKEIGGFSENNPFIRILQKAENSAYQKSDAVVSIPPYAEKYMTEHGLAKGKFICIPNGIVEKDWNHAEELPNDIKAELEKLHNHGKFIVGYFGGHALSNALDILLDCIKLFTKYENIVFVLVGDGSEKKRLVQRSKDEKIQNILFFNSIKKRAIPNLLKHFDCIYIGTHKSPLYRFGLGMNKIYDAMMAGKPIVLSATVPGSIVEEYNCGIVVPADDITKIKDAIITIYSMSDEKRRELGENGQKAVKENFLYDKLAHDFEYKMQHTGERRILLINHYAGSPDMGMEFRPYYFAKEWIKSGYKVDIIAADYSHLRIKNPKIKKDFETENVDGIQYHWIHTGTYDGNGIRRALTMFQFVWKLWINAKKIAKKYKPNVIITSSTYPLDTYAGQRIKKCCLRNCLNL